MYRGSVPWFKVVQNSFREYAVWHAEAHDFQGWQETGQFGTESECWDYIESAEGTEGFLFLLPDG